MVMAGNNGFLAERAFPSGGTYYALEALDEQGIDTSSLPYSIRVLLEGALRNCDGHLITTDDVKRIAQWAPGGASGGAK